MTRRRVVTKEVLEEQCGCGEWFEPYLRNVYEPEKRNVLDVSAFDLGPIYWTVSPATCPKCFDKEQERLNDETRTA